MFCEASVKFRENGLLKFFSKKKKFWTNFGNFAFYFRFHTLFSCLNKIFAKEIEEKYIDEKLSFDFYTSQAISNPNLSHDEKR